MDGEGMHKVTKLHIYGKALNFNWVQLSKGRLALTPGLNLTQISFSCVQKHFLG